MDFLHAGVEVQLTDAEVIAQEGHRVWIRFNPMVCSASQLIAQISALYPVADLFVENPPSEEIITKYYTSL